MPVFGIQFSRAVLITLLVASAPVSVNAKPIPSPRNLLADAADDEFKPHRGWMIKAGYASQMNMNWLEAGFGRINFFGSQSGKSQKKYLSAAAAAFTLGGEFCLSSTKQIYGPKLGIEANVVLFGARVSYAYYVADGGKTGVTTLEGGLCILSRVYLFAGYNFSEGNSGIDVLNEGWRISAGLNFPFGIRQVETQTKLPVN